MWLDYNNENEPENLPLVEMNAVSLVVMGVVSFHGIDDLRVTLAAANLTIVGTTFRTSPD